jgi:hypothetical protein
MVVMASLSVPSRQFVGVATVMANELVAALFRTPRYKLGGQAGPRLQASERIVI